MRGRTLAHLATRDVNLAGPVGASAAGVPSVIAMTAQNLAEIKGSSAQTETIGFLLMPEFPIYAFILAVEALRVANQNAGATPLLVLSDHRRRRTGPRRERHDRGSGSRASHEAPFMPNVIVFACNHPGKHITRGLLAWLRRLARHGALIGAVDTGQFALAAAGLLDGYAVALHWEAMPLFREQYPGDRGARDALFDRPQSHHLRRRHRHARLMLHLIANRHGRALAEVVANGFVHGRIRHDSEKQRASANDAFGLVNHRLASIVRTMEAHLETPLSTEALAARAGISVRQIERLMRDNLGETPSRYYLKLRLQAARNHLFYGDMPIQDIAQACGFSSPSVLSRAFRDHFGLSPREFRRQFSVDRLERFRPELRLQPGIGPPSAADDTRSLQG